MLLILKFFGWIDLHSHPKEGVKPLTCPVDLAVNGL
jgi:hypothetical protein